jgi:hypothetical protein
MTYIRTTPGELWAALTTSEFMKKYWFGMNFETDWKAGSPWKLIFPDGRIADTGEIVYSVGVLAILERLAVSGLGLDPFGLALKVEKPILMSFAQKGISPQRLIWRLRWLRPLHRSGRPAADRSPPRCGFLIFAPWR